MHPKKLAPQHYTSFVPMDQKNVVHIIPPTSGTIVSIPNINRSVAPTTTDVVLNCCLERHLGLLLTDSVTFFSHQNKQKKEHLAGFEDGRRKSLGIEHHLSAGFLSGFVMVTTFRNID